MSLEPVKDLKCGICNKQENSYVLNCQHTYCHTCLVKWNLLHPSSNSVSCPHCRVKTLLDFLQTPDHAYEHIAGLTEQLEIPHCDVCSGETLIPEKASCVCRSCQDCMCHNCGEAHKKFPLFKNHHLIALNKAKYNDEFCRKHKHKPKEFYCKECGILLCSLCATREHQQHQESVHNASKYCKGYVKEVAELLEKADTSDSIYFQHKIKYHDRWLRLQQFEKSISDMKNKVKDHAKAIIKQVQVQESKLLASIDENTATLKTWRDWAEGTESLRQHAEKLSKKCATYLKTKKPADLLLGTKDLYTEVKRGVSQCGENFPLPTVPVDFLPLKQPHLIIGTVAPKVEVYIKSENAPYCDCDSDLDDAPCQKKRKMCQ